MKFCGNCHRTDAMDGVKFTNRRNIHKFYGYDICVDCFPKIKEIIEKDPYYHKRFKAKNSTISIPKPDTNQYRQE